MIDNLYGLSFTFRASRRLKEPAANITNAALNLVRADMSHPSALRFMSETYHSAVKDARKWLKEAQEVIEGTRARGYGASRLHGLA